MMRLQRDQHRYPDHIADHRANQRRRDMAQGRQHFASLERLRDIAENDRHGKQEHRFLDRQKMRDDGHGHERHANAGHALYHSTEHERERDADPLKHVERLQMGRE